MDITILIIVLPLAFTLLILPLVLRLLIGRLVLFVVKKRYVSQFEEKYLVDDSDKKALKSVLDVLLKKLSYPFIQAYDFKSDFISLILVIQNCYSGKESDELKFSFSISDLIKCYFLLMKDLNEILNNSFWLNRIKRSRISTFKKIDRITGYYNSLFNKIPFLKILRKGRISGKIIRILLIPLLGVPSLVLSVFSSIISLFFTEIIWKYYYSILMIKCCYYTMILYGEKKSLLKEKLNSVSSSEIKELARQVEELINPHNPSHKSSFFEKSYFQYQTELKKYGISSEKDIDLNGVQFRFNSKRRALKKFLEIPVNAMKQYNPFYAKGFSDREQILGLIKSIAGVYTEKDDFIDDLRIAEVFEIFYMVSLVSFNKLMMGSLILDNLTVDFVLKAKDLNDELFSEVLQNSMPGYKKFYRSFKLLRKSRTLYKAARSANPVGLILSLSGPIAYEGMKSQLRDYLFQKAGRFTIYCYESNALKREKLFFIR